jgi:O-antigen/teichoic acid export membrane protein
MASPSYVSGMAWSGINACTAVLMPMALFVFFARTASLEAIGIIALATSCVEIIKTLALPGLYEAVLQQPDDEDRCHETVAFILLGLAIGLTAIYLAGVTVLSCYITTVATHYFAFAALGSRIVLDLAALQPQARLSQRLAYRRLAVRTIISTAAGGLVGIAVMLGGDAFAGLVSYQVSQSLAFLLMTAVGTGAAALPRLHRDCFLRMWREATLATCVRLLAASINYLDQIMAAALIGSVPLAFYNLGKRFEATFVTAAGSFSTILFQPFFASQRIVQRRQELSPSIAMLTMILGLPAAVFVTNSSTLVAAVFGQQWQQASSVAAVLAMAGFVRAIGYIPGALMSVSIRNGALLLVSLISVLTGVVLIALATPFGILWCAVMVLVRHLGMLGWMAAILRHEVRQPLRTFLTCFAVPAILMIAGALAGRLMLARMIVTQDIVHQLLPVAGSVGVGGAAGIIYFAVHFRDELFRYCTVLRMRVVTVP